MATDSLLFSWDTVGYVTGYRVSVDDDDANITVDNNMAIVSTLSTPGREYNVTIVTLAGGLHSDPLFKQNYTCSFIYAIFVVYRHPPILLSKQMDIFNLQEFNSIYIYMLMVYL